MREINKVKDAEFLRELDLENLKDYLVKIVVMNDKEIVLQSIEGRVTSGSITIDGSSAIRRAGNITFIAEGDYNDLTKIDNILSINKKVQVLIGLKNYINSNYDDIIWFKQGIFLITQPSISHSINSVTINLQLKDKMCLLNGELGGNLPASVTFDSYDQQIGLLEVDTLPIEPLTSFVYKKNSENAYYMWEPTSGWEEVSADMVGQVINVKQRIFDIIQTAVCNYGGEDIAKIIINDVPLENKQIVRYVGSDNLFYNTKTGVYSLDSSLVESEGGDWIAFDYNQDCGYVYTDFVYPGSLVTSIGDNVVSVLDKIKSQLGNYEYYYDVDGNFIFQEKRNYLNTTYDPVQSYDRQSGKYILTNNAILDKDNYQVDFSNAGETVYTFEEGSKIITSYAYNPSYTNIKNDYHIWGKLQDGNALHYHVVIKEKPKVFNTYVVYYEKDAEGNFTGRVTYAGEIQPDYKYKFESNSLDFFDDEAIFNGANIELNKNLISKFNNTTNTLELYYSEDGAVQYTPSDWRAELYMQGLAKKARQIRPDVYEQELLDLWDAIYNMKEKKFKDDIENHPNDLIYWIDYIEPEGGLQDVSVDAIGTKIYSYQQDNINKMYNTDIPDRILINLSDTVIQRASLVAKCEQNGQTYSNVSGEIYSQIAIGTYGYPAQETARELLYQYTDYNSSITIGSIPIYYLEPNTRISVSDKASGISGDYIIKSISMPMDAKNQMSITATKALKRV